MAGVVVRAWRRWAAGCLVLAGVYAGSTAGSPALTADAAPLPCPRFSESTVRVTARSANTLTHLEQLRLGPGQRDPATTFDKPAVVLRSQVFAENRTVDDQVAARVLRTVADAQGVGLAGPGSVTPADPFSVRHPGLGDEREDSYVAVFAGYRAWQGTYAVLSRCPENPAWQVTSEGTWSSYEPQRQTGTALCTLGLRQYRTSYVKGSLAFRACSRSWW